MTVLRIKHTNKTLPYSRQCLHTLSFSMHIKSDATVSLRKPVRQATYVLCCLLLLFVGCCQLLFAVQHSLAFE